MGAVTALSFMYYDITGAAFGILGLSSFIYLMSPLIRSIPYIWIAFAATFTIYIVLITYFVIRPSLGYNAITGMAEVLFLLIGAIIIIVKVGAGNSFEPFDVSGPGGVAFSSIMFGAVFSILDFTGSGVVTTVSEEIREPKKNIGKSIVFAMVLTAIALIPATYALTVGWGIDKISSFATTNDAGLLVFEKYLGPVGLVLLIVFTINSYLTNGVSKSTAVSRWWYSAARDGVVFPRKLSRIDPKHRTPVNALLAWALGSFVLDVIMGIIFGPENAAFVLEAGTGISIILVHMLSNTSLTLYTRKIGEFRFLKHGLAPAAASVVGGIVVYYTMRSVIGRWYSDPTPLNDAYFASLVITLLWVIVGGLLLTRYYVKRRPQTLVKAGEYDAEPSPSMSGNR